MSQITTHVLDTNKGSPASGVPISLFQQTDDNWQRLAHGHTDVDGRISELLPADKTLLAGVYRMNFDTKSYFSAQGKESFYPYVDVVFTLDGSTDHYHIPLLLSAFGYSTYRGS